MKGDRADLALAPEDIATVKTMKAAGIPVVVVLVSGRPLVLGDLLDQSNAIVAAWLPGTEGQGVADVLFGDYKPTGKLSFTWPKAAGKGTADPLFAYGYGLKY
jgi:beta-glucosidase